MIKVAEGQKVKLEEGRFATITSEGTLILEYTGEGPLGQDRVRVVGISTVGSQALLDLLANGEAVEQSVQATGGTNCAKWCESRNGGMCDCGRWQPTSA